MIPVFVDFETYYSKTYSLSKISTQEYIYSPEFKIHGCGVAIGQEQPRWFSGDLLKRLLERVVPTNCIVCHNANFDTAILAWHYHLKPKLIIDTVSLSRAVIGERLRSHSLSSIAKYLLQDEKGGFLQEVMGIRDLSPAQEQLLASYCLHDIDLCRRIFYALIPHLPKQELLAMDLVSRMFTEPSLLLDQALLTRYHSEVVANKMNLMDFAGVETAKELNSNPQFAEALKRLGVDPPTKISPATGKETWAFAKTDEGFQALEEHKDERVQALVAARLGARSTLAETRAATLIKAAQYGPFPVSYLFSGAQTTHRLSGCLVAETKILCYDWCQGQCEKRIVDVLPDDLVWDGLEFVAHDGIKFQGFREVTEYCGLTGTADHRVFLANGGESTLADAKASGFDIAISNSPTEDQVAAAKARALI